jgi:hypothetical protein
MIMRLRKIGFLIVAALAVCVACGLKGSGVARATTADPISGDWDVTFTLQGTSVPATFKFKLDGDKLTGTADSQHTGPGTLKDGTWAGDKLSFTLEFAKHESIAVNGALKDGKLSGEFRTEGTQGTWEAKRK